MGTLQTKFGEARISYGEKKRQLTDVYKSELDDTSEVLEKMLHTTGTPLATNGTPTLYPGPGHTPVLNPCANPHPRPRPEQTRTLPRTRRR